MSELVTAHNGIRPTNAALRKIMEGQPPFTPQNPPFYIMDTKAWADMYLVGDPRLQLDEGKIQKKAVASLARAAMTVEIAHRLSAIESEHNFTGQEEVDQTFLEKQILPRIDSINNAIMTTARAITQPNYTPSVVLAKTLDALVSYDNRAQKPENEHIITRDILQGSYEQIAMTQDTLPHFFPLYLRSVRDYLAQRDGKNPTLQEFQALSIAGIHVLMRATKMHKYELLAYDAMLMQKNANPLLDALGRWFAEMQHLMIGVEPKNRYRHDIYQSINPPKAALPFTEETLAEIEQTISQFYKGKPEPETQRRSLRDSIRECPAAANIPDRQDGEPLNLIALALQYSVGLPLRSQ